MATEGGGRGVAREIETISDFSHEIYVLEIMPRKCALFKAEIKKSLQLDKCEYKQSILSTVVVLFYRSTLLGQ